MNKKEYFEENQWGKYKIIEQTNGVKIKILQNPSDAYKEKMKKHKDEYDKNRSIKQKKIDEEKLIKDRIKELAIKELKKEGKI
jgi:hypothetical protein